MSIECASRPLAVLVLISFLAFSAAAQQTSQPSTGDPPSQTSSKQTQDAPTAKSDSATQQQTRPDVPGTTSTQGKVAGTSNDRLFYTLPNFLSLQNAGKVPPLTAKEKFKVVALGSFDPVIFPWYGFLSAISQAENSEPGYGQGWGAYGKRYGAAFADGTIENFITGAILPAALHQDPRYFQLGSGTFTHRALYAISRNVITRGDSGHSQFNYSEIVGGGMSAFISTYSYHPSEDRTVSNTMSVWATQYAYDTITIVVKEFWPDIHRKLSHKQIQEAPHPVDAKP